MHRALVAAARHHWSPPRRRLSTLLPANSAASPTAAVLASSSRGYYCNYYPYSCAGAAFSAGAPRRRLNPCCTQHVRHASAATGGSDSSTVELLTALDRRQLQALAKQHGVKANKKSVQIIRELVEILPSSSSASSSSSTSALPAAAATASGLSWPPANEDATGHASDWLAPSDLSPSNRRVSLQPSPPPAVAAPHDLDAAANLSGDLLPNRGGGLETTAAALEPHEVVEGQRLSAEHVIHLLASQNARDIARYDGVRYDAETFIIATGLSERHVKSLTDHLVHTAKQTKVPGLSSNSIVVGAGRNRGRCNWVAIDLKDVYVHLMTEGARQRYDLDTTYERDMTEEEIEQWFGE